MLCKFCANLDLDQASSEEGYKHHTSYSMLFASARKGCELCSVIIYNERYREDDNRDFEQDLENTEITCRVGPVDDGGSFPIRCSEFRQQSHPKKLDLRSYVWVFTTPGKNHYILICFYWLTLY